LSLPVLVALVAVGIALTVAAVHFTGGSRTAEIADAEHARQLFFADFPDERPGNTVVTTDGKSAFLTLSSGRSGIVQSFGDGFFTRIVSAKDVAAMSVREPGIMTIRFRDFTWTGGHFRFPDMDTAQTVAALLDPARAGKA
jgi:hypothetical protein